jgi:hypothetical protein
VTHLTFRKPQKLKLKPKRKMVFEMTVVELEDFVDQTYPFLGVYDFVSLEECAKNTCTHFTVTGVTDKMDEREWDKLVTDNGELKNNTLLLNRLCAEGHLQPGEYLIRRTL